jgi:hypothetical protein
MNNKLRSEKNPKTYFFRLFVHFPLTMLYIKKEKQKYNVFEKFESILTYSSGIQLLLDIYSAKSTLALTQRPSHDYLPTSTASLAIKISRHQSSSTFSSRIWLIKTSEKKNFRLEKWSETRSQSYAQKCRVVHGIGFVARIQGKKSCVTASERYCNHHTSKFFLLHQKKARKKVFREITKKYFWWRCN